MKINIIMIIKDFFKDIDMYWGIFAEIAFVAVISMIGFLICFVLQRWV
jgi:hypothetical protein